MKTKLLKIFLMVLFGAIGTEVSAATWSYDFFSYCTTPATGTPNVTEGANIDPTYSESSAFSANGTAFYNITTPAVDSNFGVSKAWKLSNLFHENFATSGQRIGLMATGSSSRIGFQNLTVGQTIVIEGTGSPVIEGDTPLKLISTVNSTKTGVKYGSNSNRTFNYNIYTYAVVSAGSASLQFSGGNMIYSVAVNNELSVSYYLTKFWDFSSMTIPYADGGQTQNTGLWFYGEKTKASGDTPATYYNDRVDNGTNVTNAELTYYVNADAQTADTKTKFAPTEGLFFTTNNSGYSIRIVGNLINLSRPGVVIRIPNLTKGQRVTVKIQAGAASRGFTTTGLSESSMLVSAANKWEEKSAYVTATGDVTLTSNNGMSIQSIKVEDVTYTFAAKIQDIEWASLYLPFDAAIPDGVTAYYAKTVNSTTVSLKKIETGIPANQGVVVKGSTGIYGFVSTSTVDEITSNLFEGVTEETLLTDNENYVLGGSVNEKANPVFNLYVSGEGTINLAAYKAYLPASKVPGLARTLTFGFEDDETTGLTEMKSNNNVKNSEAYNLVGQRVSTNTKGIVIINGRKYINK